MELNVNALDRLKVDILIYLVVSGLTLLKVGSLI